MENIEPLTAIKNEPLESEIGIDDIPNSLDEEIIPDVKEIDIVSHELSEGLIKRETISENTFENDYSGSVETQVFVKTENIPLIKTENITQSEYLHKTQDTRNGNVNRDTSQGVIELQGSNGYFNALQSDKQFVNFFKDLSDISRKAKCLNKKDFSECYKTIETTSCEKDKKKEKFIEVPVILIEPHKYTSLAKESTRKQNKKRYSCEKCMYTCGKSRDFKLHQLTHKTKAEIDDRLLKYRCDKCKYKTYWRHGLKNHKLTHLKPEEIQYFYCYHCSFKSKQKGGLKAHIFRHFKNEDVPFYCYICDFTTLKRDLIIEHFKMHPKHHSKYDETEYKNQLEIPYFYCYHCPYKSKRKSNLKTHIFNHLKKQEVPFHCYICDFTTLKKDLIIKHFKKHPKHHSKCDETDYKNQLETYTKKQMRYSCEKCMYSCGKSKDFKLHQLTHKTKAEIDDRLLKYRCDKCKYKTYWRNGLKNHKLTHLKPEEIQYLYCYHCSFKSKHKGGLKAHIFRHFKNEDVPFYCYICDFTTLKRDLIIEHFKMHPKHHSKYDETEYKNKLKIPYFYCYHCPYKSNRKSSVKRHIFIHFKKEEVTFHCYICDFTTLKRDLIIKHFKKHPKHHSKCDETDYKNQLETYTKKQMRYSCDKCMYTCGQSSDLKLHQLTHKAKAEIDDRLLKYRCDKCKYKTYWRNSLKNHKLTHLKPEEIQYFYCYHCSFKSKQKGGLKTHIFRHFKNEDIPFHCYICDFMTLKRESFKMHLKHHNRSDETEYRNQLLTFYKVIQP